MSGNITNLIGKSVDNSTKQELNSVIVTIVHSVEPSIITVIAMMVPDTIYFNLEIQLIEKSYEGWK